MPNVENKAPALVIARKIAPVEVEGVTVDELRAAAGGSNLTLYHKTPARNVDSILQSGLIPSHGKPTQGVNPAYNAVYFHTASARADELPLEEPARVLVVQLPINDDTARRLRPDEDTFNGNAAEAIRKGEPVAYRGPVDPTHIRVRGRNLADPKEGGNNMRKSLFLIDLNKSTATAPRHKKWYSDALARGGRWVTIHPHGGIHNDGESDARRILIDGNGYVLAGGPKEWEGHNISGLKDTHDVKPDPRKDAYQQEAGKLGSTEVEDTKGIWTASGLSRGRRSNTERGELYELHVNFKPKTEAGKKKHPFDKIAYVPLYKDSTPEDLKRRLKHSTEYTPSPEVVTALFDHFQKLQAAHAEEDQHYAGQDKEAAKKTLDELHETARQRIEAGEKRPNPYNYRRSTAEDYLNDDEMKQAREAQKHINGHAYEDYETHLKDFKDRVWKTNAEISKRKDNEQKAAREQELADRMEKEPALRKLVAQYVAAKKASPNGNAEKELAYRFFGYATNEEQHQKAMRKLHDLNEKLGLKHFELSNLAHRHKGEILPPVQPEHTREAGKIYYGDNAYDPATGTVIDVKKVGQKYIHHGWNNQTDKDRLKLHDAVDRNRDPQSKEEGMDSLLASLHNTKKYGGAHLKNWQHVAKHLALRGDSSGTLSRALNEMAHRHENDHLKQAASDFKDEMRRHELAHMLSKPNYFSKQLQEQAEKLGPSSIDQVPEYKEQPKAPEPPQEAPKAPPKEEPKQPPKKGKSDGLGYGDEATMHVTGPATFKHLKNLKHQHGGRWNAEHKRWEYNHAHGSEGHKALEEYVTKYKGLNLGHIEGKQAPQEALSKAPEPTKEEPKEEPKRNPKLLVKIDKTIAS